MTRVRKMPPDPALGMRSVLPLPEMNATLPPYKHRNPMGMTHIAALAGLVFAPIVVKAWDDVGTRRAMATEYRSARPAILSQIAAAEANQDLEALLRIHGKYSRSVTDGNFESILDEAVAKTSSRMAALELKVSRILDLARNREERIQRVDSRHDQEQPGDEPLSHLPR